MQPRLKKVYASLALLSNCRAQGSATNVRCGETQSDASVESGPEPQKSVTSTGIICSHRTTLGHQRRFGHGKRNDAGGGCHDAARPKSGP